jgi:hypothetical protein
MKRFSVAFVFSLAGSLAHAQPSKDVISTCVKSESTSPKISYAAITADTYYINEDDRTKRTETTFRHRSDVLGTWKGAPPDTFGLIYNTQRIPLARVKRLSKAVPSSFDTNLAIWGLIREGRRSYLCIAFNFEGLGQSGSFQSVHGVYLIERTTRPLRAFYTVGRVTEKGVILSNKKAPHRSAFFREASHQINQPTCAHSGTSAPRVNSHPSHPDARTWSRSAAPAPRAASSP